LDGTQTVLSSLYQIRRIPTIVGPQTGVHVKKFGSDMPLSVLVVSYSRKVMGQTGSGHFSPLAAYDSESDSVLILDTARFKYGAHWAKLPLLYDAMKPVDPDTGKSRGYALLSFVPHTVIDNGGSDGSTLQPVSLLFRSKMAQHPVRRKYKEYLSSLDSDITWDQVVSYWTQEESDSPCVWNIVEPLRLLGGEEEKETVEKLRALLKDLLYAVDDNPAPCCDSHAHKTCVGSGEALYIVYLASLSEESRSEVVIDTCSNVTRLTKEQLLCEVELIASAIETSDQTTTF
jgi:hypothetical protein